MDIWVKTKLWPLDNTLFSSFCYDITRTITITRKNDDLKKQRGEEKTINVYEQPIYQMLSDLE